ncbi:PD-(D/E)XK nuclease family protein [Blattabacterium cuenoti]|uniref:PD-(D/E)XK nuclease family protein n=1 Tax=Blattabacterium cuenoti TaxID=1653831 RepID=UPI00163C2905|nr:PD-(D/E)XK nuclease family protein [Blattabacterium cuenoti]
MNDMFKDFLYSKENYKKKIILVTKNYYITNFFYKKYKIDFFIKKGMNITFYTIKTFLEIVSGLRIINQCKTLSILLFLIEKNNINKKKFKNFINLTPKIINDFQNIDINLINIDKFFKSIILEEKISKWSINKNLIYNNNIILWKKINKYYKIFQNFLLKKNIAYKELLFRKGLCKLNYFYPKNLGKIIFFITEEKKLNNWEKKFVDKILLHKKGCIYNINKKEIIKNRLYNKYENNILVNTKINTKKLKIISVSKEIEQIKIVEDLIQKLLKKNNKIKKILLLLSDINLLIPIIDSSFIRNTKLNIFFNINYPLNIIPINYTFISIFHFLLNKDKINNVGNINVFNKKDIKKILLNGYIKKLFLKKFPYEFIFNNKCYSEFIKEDEIKKFLFKNDIWIILKTKTNNIYDFIKKFLSFIRKFKKKLIVKSNKHFLEIKFLSKLEYYIYKIKFLFRKNNFLYKKIKDIYDIYNYFINTENIKFITNNKLKKKQKSNVLLFITEFKKTIIKKFDISIITSFNYKTIPPVNKKNNFTIVSDKIKNKLEIDNFNNEYYLLHFASICNFSNMTYIIYKNYPDEINSGEKSYCINYIIANNINTKIIKKTLNFIPKKYNKKFFSIKKTKSVNKKLYNFGINGISPTSIHLYNYNPILFYYKKILGIDIEKKSYKSILGEVIHKVLQKLYSYFESNNFINIYEINKMKKKIKNIINDTLINYNYNKNIYLNNINYSLQKFLIKNYINKFISLDKKFIYNKNKIFIKNLEYKISICLNTKKLNKIVLHGIIDRIDKYNGINRIIDYKTGKLKNKNMNVSLNNIKDIFENPINKNIMQLLFYIYLWFKSDIKNKNMLISASIISLNNKNFVIQTPISFFKEKKTQISYQEYKKNFLPFLMKRITEILYSKKSIIEKL